MPSLIATATTTLVCGEIVLEGDTSLLDEPDVHCKYNSYPAVKIARLAVHEAYRGNDLSCVLVNIALGTAKETIRPAIGCRFVSVDSKKQAVGFYSKRGISILDTEENKSRSKPVMFIGLHKA